MYKITKVFNTIIFFQSYFSLLRSGVLHVTQGACSTGRGGNPRVPRQSD